MQPRPTALPKFTVPGFRQPEPDAELVALWARFLALMAAGRDLCDEAFDPISREMAAIEARLATMTATTLEGVAVLLRVSCLRSSYDGTLHDRYLRGRVGDDPPPALDPMLWRALVSVERQTGTAASCREAATP